MSAPAGNPTPYTIRRVFFLYPHTIIRELYREIVRNGFDAYLIQDTASLLPLISTYPNSILYINIDKTLKDEEWLQFTQQILNHPATASTEIGVMTDARLKKKYLSRKYLFDIGISCGFISLIPDADKLFHVVFTILEANEARGRRRHVRAHCLKGDSINFIYESATLHGDLVDISLAGALFRVNNDAPKLPVETGLDNVQLKLQGSISMAGGKIGGIRHPPSDEVHYLLLFDKDGLRSKTQENILSYVCRRQEDVIKEAFAGRPAADPLSLQAYAPTAPSDGKPNERLTQEALEELELVQSGLKEIDDMFGSEAGIPAPPPTENKFDIRS